MQRIVVLNPKGGSGKTTVAINLASHFAVQGEHPVLMDYDVQGSSAHWVRKRDEQRPQVHLISVFEREALAPAPSNCAFRPRPAGSSSIPPRRSKRRRCPS